jgi:glycosyltransferase involved in cell wall biosynthesis
LDLNYKGSRNPLRRIIYQIRFWRMLRRQRVEALHVHHATALILSGIPAWLAGVKKVVMTEHGLHQLQERPKYRKSAARYCRFARVITVVEPAQASYFSEQMGVRATKLHYVANGVRIYPKTQAQIIEMRRQLGVPYGVFAFFYVGRLSPVKDLGTLLQAVAALSPDVADNVRLYIVGEGPERPSLERQRMTLALQAKVVFLGPRGDVSDVLMAADGFVMSSVTEGLPMALLEAMAAGLPCIATSVGGIPRLLANEQGLVVPPRDPRALAAAMSSLVRMPDVRKRISENALASVREHYSFEAVADQYLTLLGLDSHFSAESIGRGSQ